MRDLGEDACPRDCVLLRACQPEELGQSCPTRATLVDSCRLRQMLGRWRYSETRLIAASINFDTTFTEKMTRLILALMCGVCLDEGSPEKRRAGWGIVYNTNDPGQSSPLEGTIGGEEQTSNRAELRAVIGYLQMRVWEAGGANRIVIATDSEYVVDGVCNWLDAWISRRWKNTKGRPIAYTKMLIR